MQDGILDRITGVTDCADVTNTHLAAITGLNLASDGITAVLVGDFDGLTSLTSLILYNNELTTLPAGVFDELTSLTRLRLFSNRLTTLPAGVFDELTLLTRLELDSNDLTTLPARVFEPLTASELELVLNDNPGAPFSPEAVALPDDGTVPSAGGTVTLDGSGSGGAWGTNVTYGWALTDPASGVTVTFDDAASATPEVTIPALTEDTELTFTLTVTGRGGTRGIAAATATAKVTAAVLDPTAGICGRTRAVRDALVDQIPDITDCADVTDTHLAAITGTLDLSSDGITALAAEDFDGLTSLTTLNLIGNDLTALPAGVFDDLTSLTGLFLGSNDLTTLPAGVFQPLTALAKLGLGENDLTTLPAGAFAGLTSLTSLTLGANDLTALPVGAFAGLAALSYLELSYNDLTTLPARVFEPLTASELELVLNDNPGAPFSPEAVALPDDGTVPSAGGAVTLDGSGSDGGPWGTNVTYGWALTDPASGVTVTFEDAASATPEVTIPALTEGTELTFTLTVTGRGGENGIAAATDTAKVTVPSTDATLSALSLSDGTVVPTFAAATTDYTALVEISISTITVTPSTTDDAATVEFLDSSDAAITDADTNTDALDASLALGENVIKVKVTAEDRTTTQTYTVTVTRAAAVSFGESAYTVDEGGTVTVTVTLSGAAGVQVEIPISAAGVGGATAQGETGEDWSGVPENVTFGATDTEQSFTLAATQDMVDDDSEGVVLSFGTLPDGVTAGTLSGATVTLEDDDAAGVTVSEAALTVTEQDATGDNYTVVLDTEPTHEVTVTVSGHSGTDVSLSSATLTFTTSNWDQAQTVTVTALNDDDTADDAVTLTHAATSTDGNYSGITIADVSVTVTDNDTTTPAVTLVLSDGSIGENGGVSTVTATVAPASAAAFTVTVAAAAVSPAVAADFELSANQVLSFAESATTSTGSVTITGVDDDVDAADKTVTVSGTVSATSVTAPANRTVTLEDDDAAGVTVSETALTVTEQDATGDNYTVVLDTEPTHEVTVTVGGHSGTDVSLSSATLTFTTSNWDQAQTVTVTALNDDDTADDAVTLTHAATSTDGNYSGITIADVSVTVTDNDTTTPAVTLVLSDGSIGENGGVSTVTATVAPASAAAFTVTVAAAAVSPAVAADFELSANQVLSFAESATTSTGSVTITGVDDDVDAADKTVTVSGTVSATSVTAPANRTLTLEDDDAAGVTVSETALTVTEQDATGDNYTVVLDTEPTHEVTVTVGGHSGTDVSLSSATLTFTTSNWDQAQTVTVTALNDDDTADDAVTLTHAATSTDGNYSGITIADVSVTVTDNDTTTPAVTLVLSDGSIGENGGVSTVTATVAPASAAAFTVTVAAAAVSPAVAADFELSANQVLSFAESATTSTGSVTITGVDDDVDAADKTVTVSGTVSNAAIPNPADVTLTIFNEDADTPPPAPTVESFEVTSWPQRDGHEDVYGFGETIVFTLAFSEKVRVKGDPQPTLAFDLGGTARDARFYGLTDTDWAKGRPSPRPRPEGVKVHFGYTVKAEDRDDDGVAVGANAIRLGGARIRSAATGLDADLSHGALGPQSDHKVDGGTAEGPAGAGVTIIDTDGNPLELQANGKHRLVIRESTRGRYGLKLNTRPTHTVDLSAIYSDGDEDLRVIPTYSPLPIAPDEWETPVWVDIRATPDDDQKNGERVFLNRVHSKDPAYNDLILPDVLVVEDDDDRPVSLSVADAEATEGEDNTVDFVVRLDPKTSRKVTVQYRTRDGTATAASDYTSTSGTLVFAPREDEKTVSVPITDDAVEDDGETFTLVLTNAWNAYFANNDNEAVGTIRNTETMARPDLTASFKDVPAAHDGSAFTFRVAFSEDIGISYRSLREDAFAVTGGSVTRGRRVDDRRDLFEMTVEPDSDGDVTIELPAGRECGVSGAICTKGDNRRQLANTPTATVAGPEAVSADLTASFVGVPEAHDGESAFTLRIAFSEPLSWMNGRRLREDVVAVAGGRATKASRVNRRRDLWQLTVEPNSLVDVTVMLAAGAACGTPAAVCTKDGRALSETISATVAGPVGISVADARVEEGAGAVLEFAVTLERAAGGAVTVDYATSDGTAQVGVDYTVASGTLTFEAGESSKTVEVAVLDDSHDEGEETMTLRLSNPSEGRLADAEATGMIENTDPLPRALLARFGRATALHVMEQVEERLEASRASGFRGRFAGRELRRGMERDMGRNFLSRLQSTAVQGARDTTGVQSDLSPAELLRMGLGGGGDLLMGSGFVLNRETGGGASVSLWSRGMESRFSGRDGELSLDGGVRTTMFGADYAKGPLMAGLMLSHRRGLGGYQGADIGQVASSVTGLHPWVGYQLTERVTLWGVTGYGRGSLSLTPGEAVSLPTSLAAPVALKGGLSMSMLAGGVRGDLVDSGAGGFGLAFKADALWVGTGSEAVDGPAGRLAGTEAVVTRVRTALEASRGYVFGHGIALRPSLEVGLRRDGGDAETGVGADVAASLIASDPLTGLSVDVRVRTLLVHQDEGFRERGVSVSFSYDPTPQTPLGFTARVAPSWGGQAMSGADALWGRDTMEGLGAAGPGSGDRIDAELGYALPVGSRLVGTPRFGVTTSEYGRDYRLGYSLAVVQGGAMSFQFGLDAQRRESLGRGDADHSLVGRLTVGW